MSKENEQVVVNILNPFEKEINQYKLFYKTYLLKIKNKASAIEDLLSILPSYQKTPYISGVTGFSDNANNIIIQTESILEKHFSDEYIKLFKKPVEKKFSINNKTNKRLSNDNVFMDIMSSIKNVFDKTIDEKKREWDYKKKLLNYTYNCLFQGGLHPKISERKEEKYKTFNFIVIHKQSRKEIIDFRSRIPWKTFHEEYLNYYNNRKPIKINGKIIPFDKIIQIKITTSLLLDDERELFLRHKKVALNKETNEVNYINLCEDETDRFHYNPFEVELTPKTPTEYLEIQQALKRFPKAYKVLNEAISKMGNDSLARNCLDDLRLCLELFLKEKLKNSKTLENQKPILGKFIKEKGGSVEIVNFFQKILEFYTSYQNSNVKHHDNAKPTETKLIFGITSSLIIHLIELE